VQLGLGAGEQALVEVARHNQGVELEGELPRIGVRAEVALLAGLVGGTHQRVDPVALGWCSLRLTS